MDLTKGSYNDSTGINKMKFNKNKAIIPKMNRLVMIRRKSLIMMCLVYAFLSLLQPPFKNEIKALSSHSMKEPSMANQTTELHSFPRWGNNSQGIEFNPLLEYIKTILNDTVEGQNHHKPTAVYFVDQNWTLWTSRRIRRRHINTLSKRIIPSERLAIVALKLLRRDISEETILRKQRYLEHAIQKGGFPFLVYHKDYNGCNHKNWRTSNNNPTLMTEHSMPVFTYSSRLDCHYAFPWPTYESVGLSKTHSGDWLKIISNNRRTYSINENKIPKAIWRGSLTGTNNKALENSSRWQLCKLSTENSNLLDARLVQLPKWRAINNNDTNLAEVGGNHLASFMPIEDFQKYAAVVDVDGNAWSSRFATLLCMDSVVLKVEPTMVDYFHFQLEPWIHYIPVSSDLHDLINNIQWVLNHPNETQTILDNAHHWCSQHMVYKSLAYDVGSIWNFYVQNLELGDTHWSDVWRQESSSLFHKMTQVESIIGTAD